MQRDEVRAREQLIERHPAIARGMDDLHLKAGCAACHRASDAPHSDDPERRAVNIGAQ